MEVGGRYTLTGASLSLRAGDKVGLVGRNGVGKTSLLKVLSGEAPAAAGVVARTGAVGYLSQDPSPRGTGHGWVNPAARLARDRAASWTAPSPGTSGRFDSSRSVR